MVGWFFGGSVAVVLIGAATVVAQFVRMVAESDLFDEFVDGEI